MKDRQTDPHCFQSVKWKKDKAFLGPRWVAHETEGFTVLDMLFCQVFSFPIDCTFLQGRDYQYLLSRRPQSNGHTAHPKQIFASVECNLGGGKLQLPAISPKVVKWFFILKNTHTRYSITSFHYSNNLFEKIFLLNLFHRQENWSLGKYFLKVIQRHKRAKPRFKGGSVKLLNTSLFWTFLSVFHVHLKQSLHRYSLSIF